MLHIILNPASRAGRAKKIWKNIEHYFKNIEYKLYKTEYEEHAIKIANEISSKNDNAIIVVVGGDGTLNEVVNGINDLKKVTIGYVPLGSGNDFARGLKLETDPGLMINKILNPTEIKEIDIGYILYGDGKKRRFNISCGFGWEATICHLANIKSPVKKILNKLHIGFLTYFILAFKVLYHFPRYNLKIITDNDEYEFDKILFFAAMNLAYEGGGYMFRSDALCDSGKLHLIVARNMSYIKAFRVLIGAKKGKHLKYKECIETMDAKKVLIESNIKQNIHVDGQPVLAKKRLEYHVEQDRLKIIV